VKTFKAAQVAFFISDRKITKEIHKTKGSFYGFLFSPPYTINKTKHSPLFGRNIPDYPCRLPSDSYRNLIGVSTRAYPNANSGTRYCLSSRRQGGHPSGYTWCYKAGTAKGCF
jgi:hypothetical protein